MQIRSKSSVRYVIWGFLCSLLLTVSGGGIHAQYEPDGIYPPGTIVSQILCDEGAYTFYDTEAHTQEIDGVTLTLVSAFATHNSVKLTLFGTGVSRHKIYDTFWKHTIAEAYGADGQAYLVGYSPDEAPCPIPDYPVDPPEDEFMLILFLSPKREKNDRYLEYFEDTLSISLQIPADFGISQLNPAPESTAEVQPTPTEAEPIEHFNLEFTVPVSSVKVAVDQSITLEDHTITVQELRLTPLGNVARVCFSDSAWHPYDATLSTDEISVPLGGLPNNEDGCMDMYANAISKTPEQLTDVKITINGLSQSVSPADTPENRAIWEAFIAAANAKGIPLKLVEMETKYDRYLYYETEDNEAIDFQHLQEIMVETGFLKLVDAEWTFDIPLTPEALEPTAEATEEAS